MNNGNTVLVLQLSMTNLDDGDNRPCVIQYDFGRLGDCHRDIYVVLLLLQLIRSVGTILANEEQFI